ncbi:hypothetical protein BJ944DRAFT_251582 [Cunninghamella echinulata]|nr:hypothetical protein BJ944DRAFT_251582 [Cunninghamella echinulata]
MSEKKQSKSIQERHERLLNELLKIPGNEYCADCRTRNPRWASYSLGVFLCVRCASIHRKMGTHISRIKSLSMDQWTMEQIETLKNAGGNIKVNNIVNPNPSKYPLPLADDEGPAMEKYIRNKWEKRAFMESQVRASPLNTANGLLQRPRNVPTRSSSVPVMNSDKLNSDILHLRQMGFTDDVKNQAALRQANGNLNAAIDMLSRNIANNSNNNGNSNSIIQTTATRDTQNTLTIDQKLVQLRNMGYTNIELNRDILRRTGGNVDVAVTLLKSNSTTTTSSLSQPVTPFQASPSSNPSSAGLLSNNNGSNNIFSASTPTSSNIQSQQQSTPIFTNGKLTNNNNSNNNNNQVGQLLNLNDTTTLQNYTTNNLFSLQQQQQQQQQQQMQMQMQLQQQQLQQQQLLQQQSLQSFSSQSTALNNTNQYTVSTPLDPFGQNSMSIPSSSANSIQAPQTSSYFSMMPNNGTMLNGITNQMTGMPFQQQQPSVTTPTNNPFSTLQPQIATPQQQVFTPTTISPFNTMAQQPQQLQQQQLPFNQFPSFTQQQQTTRSSFF